MTAEDLIKNYKVIRSSRRTMSMEFKGEELVVRVPRFASRAVIDQFVLSNMSWIERSLKKKEKQAAVIAQNPPLTQEELKALKEQAKIVIPERVAYYAPKVGVTYNGISIRCQKTRWGSCSAKGNLNFNCLLMLAPPEVLDSVVVHELCHRKQMNHSQLFYSEVLRVFPDYYRYDRWLKNNGAVLMARVGSD